MGRIKSAIALLLLLLPGLSIAAPFYGFNLSIAAVPKEPPHLRGYQFMFSYDPQRFKWRRFNVYFDGGFSHFWDTQSACRSAVSIYSIAPVIRYTFKRRGPLLPYLELSIGAAYLNHTRMESRNLGMHYSFQDRFGIGALLGKSAQFSLGLHAVHYSNAHLSRHNSGLSVPVEVDIGYRFS